MKNKDLFAPTHVLVRELATTFDQGLKQNSPQIPINVDLARQQHDHYVKLLQRLVPQSWVIPAEAQYPDCCFIEDTAIVIGSTAMVNRLGALERRGEEIEVRKVLKSLAQNGDAIQSVDELEAPAFLDGGDVLFTGEDIFIGLSKRTNLAAVEQLRKVFTKELPRNGGVYGIPVKQGLHLKSVMTAVAPRTLVVSEQVGGENIQRAIEAISQIDKKYSFITVPDSVSSNLLRVGSTLIIQDGFPESEAILKRYALQNGLKIEKLTMSELIKADGCLTCCSILV